MTTSKLSRDYHEVIAETVYPTKWRNVGRGFRVDQNAGRRPVAAKVAKHFIAAIEHHVTDKEKLAIIMDLIATPIPEKDDE